MRNESKIWLMCDCIPTRRGGKSTGISHMWYLKTNTGCNIFDKKYHIESPTQELYDTQAV